MSMEFQKIERGYVPQDIAVSSKRCLQIDLQYGAYFSSSGEDSDRGMMFFIIWELFWMRFDV
jgi:hypothetical protein